MMISASSLWIGTRGFASAKPASDHAAIGMGACCPVVELRQYTLHPGTRDTLIELFDGEFVESQEAVGATIVGQFRDIDRPDVFTWIRGFPSMAARVKALSAFYDGPVWAAHGAAANATMVSSDNVRLLRPSREGGGFVLRDDRAPRGSTTIPHGLLVATILTIAPGEEGDMPALFEGSIAPHLVASGARPFATFETEHAANDFPRLPVREGEHAFVWFTRFDDIAAYERHLAALANDREWNAAIRPALERRLLTPPEIWRLTPTARSHSLR